MKDYIEQNVLKRHIKSIEFIPRRFADPNGIVCRFSLRQNGDVWCLFSSTKSSIDREFIKFNLSSFSDLSVAAMNEKIINSYKTIFN